MKINLFPSGTNKCSCCHTYYYPGSTCECNIMCKECQLTKKGKLSYCDVCSSYLCIDCMPILKSKGHPRRCTDCEKHARECDSCHSIWLEESMCRCEGCGERLCEECVEIIDDGAFCDDCRGESWYCEGHSGRTRQFIVCSCCGEGICQICGDEHMIGCNGARNSDDFIICTYCAEEDTNKCEDCHRHMLSDNYCPDCGNLTCADCLEKHECEEKE